MDRQKYQQIISLCPVYKRAERFPLFRILFKGIEKISWKNKEKTFHVPVRVNLDVSGEAAQDPMMLK